MSPFGGQARGRAPQDEGSRAGPKRPLMLALWFSWSEAVEERGHEVLKNFNDSHVTKILDRVSLLS